MLTDDAEDRLSAVLRSSEGATVQPVGREAHRELRKKL
jgi:hypothetical protein